MRPGVLGGLGWLLLLAVFCAWAVGALSPRRLRDAWRGPEALSGELTPSLACDLVTDFVLERSPKAKVSCEGELEVLGEVARLTGVRGGAKAGTYCLARAPRWTVLRFAGEVVPCFPTPPEGDRPVVAERARVEAAALERWRDRVAGLSHPIDDAPVPESCDLPPQKGSSRRTPVIDAALVDEGEIPVGWDFLTTTWLREGLMQESPETALSALEGWGAGTGFVVVIAASSRRLPVANTGKVWSRGHFQGELTVVETATGRPWCRRAFEFNSSMVLPTLTPPRRRGKAVAPILNMAPTASRVEQDFHTRYFDAVNRAVGQMTSYRLWPALN